MLELVLCLATMSSSRKASVLFHLDINRLQLTRNKSKIWPELSYYLAAFYILITLSYCCQQTLASEARLDDQATSGHNQLEGANLQQLCLDCRLTSDSVEDLIRRPRQMDAYGQVSARIDLDKIKKAVCKELLSDSDRQRCRSFYFEHQPSVIRWKQQQQQQQSAAGHHTPMTFLDFVCIKDLKYCCPEHSYGPRCARCSSCSEQANKRCDGDGTRVGNGTCVCRPGHGGADCDTCLAGYYNAAASEGAPPPSAATLGRKQAATRRQSAAAASLVKCKPCHRACKLCHAEGPQNCELCQPGYRWTGPQFGCSDVDECLEGQSSSSAAEAAGPVCRGNTFCVNTEGSYYCYECDRACQGCHGDGPDMCLKCAPGYKLTTSPDGGGGGVGGPTTSCVATKQTILPPEANYYRYAVYLGLCISTCIILHNSVYWASFIGLCVALYIGLSEYVMSGHPAGQFLGQTHESQLAQAMAGSLQEQLMSQQQGRGQADMHHLDL